MADETAEPSRHHGGTPASGGEAAPGRDSSGEGSAPNAAGTDAVGEPTSHEGIPGDEVGAPEDAGAADDHDGASGDDYNDEEPYPYEAGETRGWHFARLAFHPVTLSYGTIAAFAVFSILTVIASPVAGAIGAAATLVLTYVVVFVIAGRRATEDFYSSYAEERGLARRLGGALPSATPLLRKGDRRGAVQIMTGELPGGLTGTLGLYTCESDTRDGDGEPDVDYFDYTVVLSDLPETAAKARGLHCERRSGFRVPGSEDPAAKGRRLELGDEAFERAFEIFFDPRDDERWLRGLFSPDFVAWLTATAPPGLAFELVAGSLNVNVEDHLDSVEELDELCEAAAVVAERLREAART